MEWTPDSLPRWTPRTVSSRSCRDPEELQGRQQRCVVRRTMTRDGNASPRPTKQMHDSRGWCWARHGKKRNESQEKGGFVVVRGFAAERLGITAGRGTPSRAQRAVSYSCSHVGSQESRLPAARSQMISRSKPVLLHPQLSILASPRATNTPATKRRHRPGLSFDLISRRSLPNARPGFWPSECAPLPSPESCKDAVDHAHSAHRRRRIIGGRGPGRLGVRPCGHRRPRAGAAKARGGALPILVRRQCIQLGCLRHPPPGSRQGAPANAHGRHAQKHERHLCTHSAP